MPYSNIYKKTSAPSFSANAFKLLWVMCSLYTALNVMQSIVNAKEREKKLIVSTHVPIKHLQVFMESEQHQLLSTPQ